MRPVFLFQREAHRHPQRDSSPHSKALGKIIGTMIKKRNEFARFNSVKSLGHGLEMLHVRMVEMDEWETKRYELEAMESNRTGAGA